MTLADRARQVAADAPQHQSAEVLRECAAALTAKEAEIAQLLADFQHAKVAGMVEAYRAIVSGFGRNLPAASAAKWPELAEATAAAWDWREAQIAENARLRSKVADLEAMIAQATRGCD